MNNKLNLVNEKLVNNCYNNFETRHIDGKCYKIMPLVEYVPRHIDLEYNKNDDKIVLILQDSSQSKKISINNIAVFKDSNNNSVSKIEFHNISRTSQKEEKQEMNECIKIFTAEKDNILFYDLNLRALELFKRIILNLDKTILNLLRQVI
jgi:hypothetical protein